MVIWWFTSKSNVRTNVTHPTPWISASPFSEWDNTNTVWYRDDSCCFFGVYFCRLQLYLLYYGRLTRRRHINWKLPAWLSPCESVETSCFESAFGNYKRLETVLRQKFTLKTELFTMLNRNIKMATTTFSNGCNLRLQIDVVGVGVVEFGFNVQRL